MKLSILIPCYCYDPRPLVRALCRLMTDDEEIIVGDDCTPSDQSESYLSDLAQWERVRVVRQQENRGAAAMRNRLAREATGEYLLFLDCDALPLRSSFLAEYLKQLPTDEVLCGSICHAATLPDASVSLRWTYEKRAERRFTAKERNKHPYQNFRTFNFLIPRETMLRCPFDETVRLSGYEDTLAGKAFRASGIRIRHIENPLLNMGLEDNETFLRKTERQLRTLHEKRGELRGFSSLLAAYRCVECMGLAGCLRFLHRRLAEAERRNLLSLRPRIWVFQLYKLGYYATIK
ncbi:MAG: glycosyltransferase [Bacteroidaceae bacterium]|nr:glycosyltransferase [Bacteroidaceae bacterium]